jgi:hypothetical protein
MIANAHVSFGVMFLAPAKCQGGDLSRCSKLHRYSITGAPATCARSSYCWAIRS